MEKRYQFWSSEDGKPVKKWTEWFSYNGEKFQWQLKNKLKNEYSD